MLRQDLKFAVRMMLKDRGFTGVAVLTLAVGIGGTTAVFSVVNRVVFNPVPFDKPDELVMIWENSLQRGFTRMFASAPNAADWESQNQVFQSLACFKAFPAPSVTLSTGQEPEQVPGVRVSASLFPLLGVRPILGRAFLPEEDEPGTPGVVILGFGLWHRRFGADPTVIGRTVSLDAEPHTIVGVMPRGFAFPPRVSVEGTTPQAQSELWMPLLDRRTASRVAHNLGVVARLKPGVSLERARADMNAIAQRLEQAYPGTNVGWGVTLTPLAEQMVGNDLRLVLLAFMGAVACMWLLACVNVANLMLMRGVSRQREIAIRASLGASRWRLARQLITESLLLALVGGVVGALLGRLGMGLLVAVVPGNIPGLTDVRLDGDALAAAFVLCVATGLLCGLMPALHVGRPRLSGWLTERESGQNLTQTRQRTQGVLVVTQVALALVLVVSAGLLLRSILRLRAVDPGFRPDGLLSLHLTMPGSQYAEPGQRARFVEEALRRLEALPTIRLAGAINRLPITDDRHDREGTSFWIEGEARPQPGQAQHTNLSFVSPGYFQAMGVPLLRGRFFTERDRQDAPAVVIINHTFAQRFFAHQDPLGKRLNLRGVLREIVGVVHDVRHAGLAEPATPDAFVPFGQSPSRQVAFVLRTTSAPAASLAAARGAIRSVDPGLAVFDVRAGQQIVAESIAIPRFAAYVVGAFAAVALVLATVGVYGVVSYWVTQRTREIGVRIALGAQRRDILWLVLRHGAGLAFIGLVAGLGAAPALTRLLSHLLFGITATDLPAFAAAGVVFAAVALLACYVPARRALRIDPAGAFRSE